MVGESTKMAGKARYDGWIRLDTDTATIGLGKPGEWCAFMDDFLAIVNWLVNG